jgi:hypothetical protein
VLLTTNCRPVLQTLLRQLEERTVITLDAGGFPPWAAAAFDTVTADDATSALRKHDIPEDVPVSVPISLATAWGWKKGSSAVGWSINLVPDDEVDYLNDLLPYEAAEPDGLISVRRGTFSLGYGIGQALLLALPLAVFGLLPVIIGVSLLLTSAFLLGMTWRLLQFAGTFRGAVIGLVLFFCLSAWTVTSMGFNEFTWLRLPASAFLLAAWMGIVLQGNR